MPATIEILSDDEESCVVGLTVGKSHCSGKCESAPVNLTASTRQKQDVDCELTAVVTRGWALLDPPGASCSGSPEGPSLETIKKYAYKADFDFLPEDAQAAKLASAVELKVNDIQPAQASGEPEPVIKPYGGISKAARPAGQSRRLRALFRERPPTVATEAKLAANREARQDLDKKEDCWQSQLEALGIPTHVAADIDAAACEMGMDRSLWRSLLWNLKRNGKLLASVKRGNLSPVETCACMDLPSRLPV
eukprot:TRINITY_DN23834_c1_g3_i3.p1 TRINITY_DN23834_c1_g3~~TRINITY_DN23834_c1_g3_i3.p1  ORF type:complete len:250 (-),score=40.69 TRINITY_DN23834_c1_g3_i3:135-884(-)